MHFTVQNLADMVAAAPRMGVRDAPAAPRDRHRRGRPLARLPSRTRPRDDALHAEPSRSTVAQRGSADHLAARFAAKEAVLKAFGTGIGRRMRWTDVEIVKERAAGRRPPAR